MMIKHATVVITAAWLLLQACGGNNTPSYVEAPGQEKTAESEILGVGADLLQDKSPLKKLNIYLDGFHFYGGNMEGQMEAHHYVSQLNEDLHPAITFAGSGNDAESMGTGYIVTERRFKQVPEEGKKLWQSRHHEVKSGTLIAPGMPDDVEHVLMEKRASTYGKTIH